MWIFRKKFREINEEDFSKMFYEQRQMILIKGIKRFFEKLGNSPMTKKQYKNKIVKKKVPLILAFVAISVHLRAMADCSSVCQFIF